MNIWHFGFWVKPRSLGAVAAALGLPVVVMSVAAAPPSAVGFSHKDWALQCDNTRTCRAVGYQTESGDSDPVSIRLTRQAGPHAPVQIDLVVQSESPYQGPLQFHIGKVVVRGLKTDGASIPAAQVGLVIRELLKNEEATLHAGQRQWTLSLAGASAVLLKMDDAQGRVGTPGAMVRKGVRPESAVLAPLSAPEVRAVVPTPTRPGDAALAKPLLAAIDRAAVADQCNGDPLDPAGIKVYRLTPNKVLLEAPCGMGAYNFGNLLWIANDQPPYQAKLLDTDGGFNPADGSVSSSMKVRGIGDCWFTRSWQFDGQNFVQTHEAGDSMCRGFAGGAWQLPVYLSTVASPATKPSKKPSN